MKTTKIFLGLALLAGSAWLLLNNWPGNREKPEVTPKTELEPLPSSIRVKRVLAPRNIPVENLVTNTQARSPSTLQTAATTPPVGSQAPQVTTRKQKNWQDPQAREALKLVGADAEAEVYWMVAINDPDLPVKERKDLIEDLNEEGFPDPKRVTEDDLPLIISRIELIEQLAPDAMDQANADAFGEAYKDLINMYHQALTR